MSKTAASEIHIAAAHAAELCKICKPHPEARSLFINSIELWLLRANGRQYEKNRPQPFNAYKATVKHLRNIQKVTENLGRLLTGSDDDVSAAALLYIENAGGGQNGGSIDCDDFISRLYLLELACEIGIREAEKEIKVGRPRYFGSRVIAMYIAELIIDIEDWEGTASISRKDEVLQGTIAEILRRLISWRYLTNRNLFNVTYRQAELARRFVNIRKGRVLKN
ncbi:hypothetical protein [Mongoliimonas terrestris]|uniref:hypothetical protein n=1 Tax=Mongoliimonas terrestris TaxID=1709001 RepID=UPI001115067F|nr:hypothetical protein [Mongoliimonas terrestris]